jgi:hypothetical protein
MYDGSAGGGGFGSKIKSGGGSRGSQAPETSWQRGMHASPTAELEPEHNSKVALQQEIFFPCFPWAGGRVWPSS